MSEAAAPEPNTPTQASTMAIDGHVERIRTDGYTIVPDAVDPNVIDAMVDDLDRLARELAVKPARNSFEGTQTLRIYNLLAHGVAYHDVPVLPSVLPIVEGVLDAGCLISSLSSISIGAGEVAQPIHADDQMMPLDKPHVATVCNTMWALTDFTEANGATRIVPASHLADRSPRYGASIDSVPAEMPRGSVLVWHGSLWHGGGANTTDQPRIGLAMNYCAGWVRQQENQQLGIPIEVVRGFSPRLRELCGFGVYNGLIGHIDRRSPADVLLGPEPEPDSQPLRAENGRDPTMVWDGG